MSEDTQDPFADARREVRAWSGASDDEGPEWGTEDIVRSLGEVLAAHDRLQARLDTQALIDEQAGARDRALIEHYRSRCPVLVSDVGPEHTAARAEAYALANGWASVQVEGTQVLMHETSGVSRFVPNTPRKFVEFCNRHAKATGLAPLDVLDAIGAMP